MTDGTTLEQSPSSWILKFILTILIKTENFCFGHCAIACTRITVAFQINNNIINRRDRLQLYIVLNLFDIIS